MNKKKQIVIFKARTKKGIFFVILLKLKTGHTQMTLQIQ